MKKIAILFLIIMPMRSMNGENANTPKIFIQEETGETDRVSTGKIDCATDENFGQLLKNGQYDLCRDYLGNKTLAEIAAIRRKYGKQKIDEIMGDLFALPPEKQAKLSVKQINFLKKGGYKSFPLHARAFFGDTDAVKWFLKYHPRYDVSTTTPEGYTAADVARNEGYTQVSQMLTPTKSKSRGFNFAQSKLFWFIVFFINCHLLASQN